MRPPRHQNQPVSNNPYRINGEIKAKEVRLIDHNGQMIGVVQTNEAINMAENVNLDLVEVSPNVNPPVCKIANFGKMKYELQKKASDAKKKQKVVEVKEIKLSLNIGKNDYDVKIKRTIEFIKDNNKVKVSIRMKGREITHSNLAREMMNNVVLDVEEVAKPENPPRLEGMQMVAIFVKK